MLYLVPRWEWHGGWSPPLRYIVVFMPMIALGAAALWQRISAAPIILAAAWTFGVTAHGLAYPWRLFHIENGENIVGETLSTIWHSDFSRLFPSFIRPNFAAIIASILAIVAVAIFRVEDSGPPLSGQPRAAVLHTTTLIALVLAAAFVIGRRPGNRIEFEDAHVIHHGGELYPREFQVQRFAFRGGWILHAGDSLTFLARRGPSVVQYAAGVPSVIQIGHVAYPLPATTGYGRIRVNIAESGRIELRCLNGMVNLDRMDHE
jgi:hypothetical protein